MPYSILFEFQVLIFIFNTYCTTRDLFMANVMDATLANHGAFSHQHAQDVEVILTQYKKTNGIPSPSSNDTCSP
jgi:hypothetical protein